MAKYEEHLTCRFRDLLASLDAAILGGSISASYEDGSTFSDGEIQCATRVYERYSYIGSNRVSLNVTLFGRDGDIHLSAITSGGSQALFFKVNTFGEAAFLDKLIEAIERFKQQAH